LVVVFEAPYQVGDHIEIDDHYGEVVDVGGRATRLQTPDDLVAVPNYLAITDTGRSGPRRTSTTSTLCSRSSRT